MAKDNFIILEKLYLAKNKERLVIYPSESEDRFQFGRSLGTSRLREVCGTKWSKFGKMPS